MWLMFSFLEICDMRHTVSQHTHTFKSFVWNRWTIMWDIRCMHDNLQCEFSTDTFYKPSMFVFLYFEIINNQSISAKSAKYFGHITNSIMYSAHAEYEEF